VNFVNYIKITLYAIIVGFKYLFKPKDNNNDIQVSFSGIMNEDIFESYKINEIEFENRKNIYSLSYGSTYLFYLTNTAEVVNKQSFEDGRTYVVAFPNSYHGIKLMFEQLYELQPKWFRIINLTGTTPFAFIIKLFLKIKIIAELRGIVYYGYVFFKPKNTKEKIKNYLNKQVVKFCYRNADFIYTFPTHSYEAEIIRKKADVYTCDLNLAAGNWKFAKGHHLELAANKPDEKVMDFISNFDIKIFNLSRLDEMFKSKMIDFFLEVKKKTNKKICFIMIGDGIYLDKIKERYKEYSDCIYFTGYLKHDQAFPIIQNLDLLIDAMPGYTVFEVGYFGIPTITYDFHLAQELIINHINGYRVDKSTPHEFGNAILDYINKSDKDRGYMKKMSKELWEKRFTSENIEKERLRYTDKIFKYSSDSIEFKIC